MTVCFTENKLPLQLRRALKNTIQLGFSAPLLAVSLQFCPSGKSLQSIPLMTIYCSLLLSMHCGIHWVGYVEHFHLVFIPYNTVYHMYSALCRQSGVNYTMHNFRNGEWACCHHQRRHWRVQPEADVAHGHMDHTHCVRSHGYRQLLLQLNFSFCLVKLQALHRPEVTSQGTCRLVRLNR